MCTGHALLAAAEEQPKIFGQEQGVHVSQGIVVLLFCGAPGTIQNCS